MKSAGVKVLGIDPSLNSTGISYRLADGTVHAYCLTPGNRKGLARVMQVRDLVEGLLSKTSPDLVAFEGYALGFRGKSNTIFDIGELGGTLKISILERGVDILLVPPNSLKMFVTGKGNADKKDVGAALSDQYGLSFSKSDQYDAAGLLMMGECHLNRRLLPRDVRHFKRRALAGCSVISSTVCEA